ncbi:MAG: superoxide dismutase [Ni] [Desulfobacterales bacterium]
MKKILSQILVGCFFIFILCVQAYAHCEIPCGIYDDEMQIKIINEHIVTVEKSMNQIIELEKKEHHNPNQLVRWILNKENHADKIQEIVSQYFMTQRITLEMKNYEKQLGLLHQMLIYSMKCKQTTDLANVTKLKSIVNDFDALYFKKK